jgi:hypothetical protein
LIATSTTKTISIMSFFNFDYNPSNPQVGDRVIVVGDEHLNNAASGFIGWFADHNGGEFYISEVVGAGEVKLASPLTNSIAGYTWRTDWLQPAPSHLDADTYVMVTRAHGDMQYRGNLNWCDDMNQYTYTTRQVQRLCGGGSSNYFLLYGNNYSWHRDWMFVMPESQIAHTSWGGVKEQFLVGDTVMVFDQDKFGDKGVITHVSFGGLFFAVESSQKPGLNRSFKKDELMLLSRNGQLTYEPNDARLLAHGA